jgi:hypothetical protein
MQFRGFPSLSRINQRDNTSVFFLSKYSITVEGFGATPSGLGLLTVVLKQKQMWKYNQKKSPH